MAGGEPPRCLPGGYLAYNFAVGRIFGPIGFAYALYASHWQVWLLSIPVATLRVVQILTDGVGSVAAVASEVAVEGLRIVQAVLAVAAAKGIPARQLTARAAWKPADRGSFRLRTMAWELLGYGIVFGAMNLAISWSLDREVVMGALLDLAGGDVARDRMWWAAALAIKNLILIPTSVIAMLRILRLLP